MRVFQGLPDDNGDLCIRVNGELEILRLMILQFFIIGSQVVVGLVILVQDLKRVFGANLLSTNWQPYNTLKQLDGTLLPNILIRPQYFCQ